MTAGELLNELESDSEYQNRIRQRDEAIKRRQEERHIEQAELIRELSDLGVEVESIWDLVNTAEPYPVAVPILIKHLDRPYSERVREGIIRALAVKEARGVAAPYLTRIFLEETNEDVRWIIGNTLAIVADESCLKTITEILRSKAYGGSRSMLVHAVSRLLGKEAVPCLIELLNDSELRAESLVALGKLGGNESKRAISQYQDDRDDWIRECARKALRNIERKEKRKDEREKRPRS